MCLRSFVSAKDPIMNARIQLPFGVSLLYRFAALFLSRPKARAKDIHSTSLEDISYHLMVNAMTAAPGSTALEFLPIMERTATFSTDQWAHLADRPDGREVLVDNEFLKVVIIRWAPGTTSNLHGHPKGGGVIKVLEGAIAEARYHTLESTAPFSEHIYRAQATSYIDDSMGMHTVGDPFPEPAVTLHAYLKYR